MLGPNFLPVRDRHVSISGLSKMLTIKTLTAQLKIHITKPQTITLKLYSLNLDSALNNLLITLKVEDGGRVVSLYNIAATILRTHYSQCLQEGLSKHRLSTYIYIYLVEAKGPMRVNISFVDQLELPVRAQVELSRVDQVTDGACSDYRCAVNIIPEWVSVQVSMIKKN